MVWKCKLCAAAFDQRAQLLQHYRLRHSNLSSISPLPCVYDDCICTFQSINALKINLTRIHTQTVGPSQAGRVTFFCPKCGFKQLFNDKSNLRSHLKKHETVDCPFKNCNYRSNVYSSFNAHKSRTHPNCDVSDFKNEVIHIKIDSQSMQSEAESDEGDLIQSTPEVLLRVILWSLEMTQAHCKLS